MTTIRVEKDGSGDFKTISDALAAAKQFDSIEIGEGIYEETFNISVPNVALVAADGARVIISGGYMPSKEFNGKTLSNVPGDYKPSWVIGSRSNQESLIKIAADGVVLDGLEIRWVAGKAFVVQGNNATIVNCTIDFTYAGSFLVDVGVSGTLIENCNFWRGSMKLFDPKREGGGPSKVQTSCLFKGAKNSVFNKNFVAMLGGEGVNAGVGSSAIIISNNEIRDTNHWAIGNLHTKDSVIQENLVWFSSDNPDFQDSGNPSDGIVIGNETGRSTEISLSNPIIILNKVLGPKRGLQLVRAGSNYTPTWLDGALVLDNEFYGWDVFGSDTKPPKALFEFKSFDGYPHKNTTISGNRFANHSNRPNPLYASNYRGDVEFSENLWTTTPPNDMQGSGDVVRNQDALIEKYMDLVSGDPIDFTADFINPKRLWNEVMGEEPVEPEQPEPPIEPEPVETIDLFLPEGWYEIESADETRMAIWVESGWYEIVSE